MVIIFDKNKRFLQLIRRVHFISYYYPAEAEVFDNAYNVWGWDAKLSKIDTNYFSRDLLKNASFWTYWEGVTDANNNAVTSRFIVSFTASLIDRRSVFDALCSWVASEHLSVVTGSVAVLLPTTRRERIACLNGAAASSQLVATCGQLIR